MRETVARIAKPAVIALAGAAAMFSAASPASAMPVVEKDLPVGGEVAEAALDVPVLGEATDRTPPIADLATYHDPVTEAATRVPQRVIEVPLAVANVPLTAVGSAAGHTGGGTGITAPT